MAELSQPSIERACAVGRDHAPALRPVERSARDEVERSGAAALAFAKSLAIQDWFVGAYFVVLFVAVLCGGSPTRDANLVRVLGDLGIFVVGLGLTRTGVLRPGSRAHGLVYRGAILTSLLASYFQLRDILPAVTTRSVDADILAFDLHVFGYEPAIAWDRWVTPHTTEWFAFFYFGYFFLLVGHVIPMALLDDQSDRLATFVLGAVVVFCVGHVGYMLVPGFGPWRLLDGRFEHDLHREGGLLWRLAFSTVQAGGAQKDIFPSLHTAVPMFFAIFSFQHRRRTPFRYTWPFVAFAATQILIATMFLRWHWLVDVVAGVALAWTAAVVTQKVASWESARRHRRGLRPIFEPLRLWKRTDEARTPQQRTEHDDRDDGGTIDAARKRRTLA